MQVAACLLHFSSAMPGCRQEYSSCLKQLVAQKDGLLAQDGTPIEVAVEMLRYIGQL